jgi:hypothetical protein
MQLAQASLIALSFAVAGCQFTVVGVGGGGTSAPTDPTAGDSGTPQTGSPDDLAQAPTGAPDLGTPGPGPMPMPPPPKGGDVGASCDPMHKCAPGLQCATNIGGPMGLNFPGGYCTQSCMSASCPSGSTCTDVHGQQFCLAACQQPTDCQTGAFCCNNVCVDTKCD